MRQSKHHANDLKQIRFPSFIANMNHDHNYNYGLPGGCVTSQIAWMRHVSQLGQPASDRQTRDSGIYRHTDRQTDGRKTEGRAGRQATLTFPPKATLRTYQRRHSVPTKTDISAIRGCNLVPIISKYGCLVAT